MSEVRFFFVGRGFGYSYGYADCVGEPLEVTLGQDNVVLRIAVTVEFLNSVTDKADLTVEALSPVGRSGRNVVVDRCHFYEKDIKTSVGCQRTKDMLRACAVYVPVGPAPAEKFSLWWSDIHLVDRGD